MVLYVYHMRVIVGTDLQENSDYSESVRLAGSLTKAWVFGVPVHQMELEIKTNKMIQL